MIVNRYLCKNYECILPLQIFVSYKDFVNIKSGRADNSFDRLIKAKKQSEII